MGARTGTPNPQQGTRGGQTYFFRPTFSATSTRSVLRWARSQLLVDEVDMADEMDGRLLFWVVVLVVV